MRVLQRRSRRPSPADMFNLRLLVLAILALGPALAVGQPAVMGQWSPPINLSNVAIHVHVLPNGKVMYWSRREAGETLDAGNSVPNSVPNTTPRLWDPATGTVTTLAKPGFNLFCCGHAFLPDGRLLAVGGHITDAHGHRHATIYDPSNDTWTQIDDMNRGRWYPTAVSMPSGEVLVSSGSDENDQVNDVQQVEQNGHWRSIVNFDGLPLYPRMHVAPDGRVFMSGPLQLTQLLDTSGGGQWTVVGNRSGFLQDYAPSVMYDTGKVLFIGGGLPPTKTAQTIDLNQAAPAWKGTGNMAFARRHHNATILPDGTVLVTGGTSGNGGPNPFNDESKPVKQAELWDPATGKWRMLAAEAVPRLYHSTAVLLPDGRVLSAGGGEYAPPGGKENLPQNSHLDAQLFSPPYLFQGPRPDLTNAPAEVTYGQTFDMGTSNPGEVGQVNWIDRRASCRERG